MPRALGKTRRKSNEPPEQRQPPSLDVNGGEAELLTVVQQELSSQTIMSAVMNTRLK